MYNFFIMEICLFALSSLSRISLVWVGGFMFEPFGVVNNEL
jgi:hypothetical protein